MSRVGLTILLTLGLAGWIATLGGMGQVTHLCTNQKLDRATTTSTGRIDSPELALLLNSIQVWPETFHPASETINWDYGCGIQFSFEWWATAFQLFTTILGFLATFMNAFQNKFIVLTMFSISTALYSVFTSIYVTFGYGFNGGARSSFPSGQAVAAVVAGTIVTAITNFLVIMVFGASEPRLPPSFEDNLPSVSVEAKTY